jgi:hypothetical protein
MAAKSKVITDHEEIRTWVEERGGAPAAVTRTRGGRGRGEGTGILRIDFPGFSGEGSLEPISWDEFFEEFDRAKLAFLCQDSTAGGEPSNFNKLVKRNTAERKTRTRSGARGRGRGAASRRGRRTATSRARNRTARGRTGTSRGRSRRRKRAATGARGRGRRGRRTATARAQKRNRRRKTRQSLVGRRRSM